MAAKQPASGVDEAVTAYLSTAPTSGRQRYARLRQVVHDRAGVDRVSERLSYRLPTFFVAGTRLLHVGLWEEHLPIYPVPDSAADPTLAAELEPYRMGKGTLHFRYDADWPAELIERIVAAHLARLG